MAQPPTLLPTSVGAPPGFATLNLQPAAKSSAPAATVAAAMIPSLNVADVKLAANDRCWRCVYTNEQESVVSFSVDRARETISVNVFYDRAVVGIVTYHPRMGKTQSFKHKVGLADLKKIFRDPKAHTGDGHHHNTKKQKKKTDNQTYSYIGDRVHVEGYEDAVIIGEPKWPGDLAKIRFANGKVYRVETSRLTLIDRPHLGCKSLEAEAEMQLERLKNELDRIMAEKMRCEKIIQLQQRFGGPSNFVGIHDVTNMNYDSPKRDVVSLSCNHKDLKKVSPSPRAVVGAFEPYKPKKVGGAAVVGAFEPYKPNKGSNGVSIWSSEFNHEQTSSTSTILPPFFPVNF